MVLTCMWILDSFQVGYIIGGEPIGPRAILLHKAFQNENRIPGGSLKYMDGVLIYQISVWIKTL